MKCEYCGGEVKESCITKEKYCSNCYRSCSVKEETKPIENKEGWEDRFVEQGADMEHERWSRWQKWCNKVLRELCPSAKLEKVLGRWDRQIATKYVDLTEKEKESDRIEVRKYLPLIREKEKEAKIEQIKSILNRHNNPYCSDKCYFDILNDDLKELKGD